MPILKTAQTGNGQATAHRVTRAELEVNNLTAIFKVTVSSYATIEDALASKNLLWQTYPQVTADKFNPADPINSLELALLSNDECICAGGTWTPEQQVDDLASAKAKKTAQIKAIRTQVQVGGFDVEGIGRFDSDAYSYSMIVGGVTAAQVSASEDKPFSVNWTLEDNSTATLDGRAMIRVGQAMFSHYDGAQEQARDLVAQVEAAETVEDVNNVNWSYK